MRRGQRSEVPCELEEAVVRLARRAEGDQDKRISRAHLRIARVAIEDGRLRSEVARKRFGESGTRCTCAATGACTHAPRSIDGTRDKLPAQRTEHCAKTTSHILP